MILEHLNKKLHRFSGGQKIYFELPRDDTGGLYEMYMLKAVVLSCGGIGCHGGVKEWSLEFGYGNYRKELKEISIGWLNEIIQIGFQRKMPMLTEHLIEVLRTIAEHEGIDAPGLYPSPEPVIATT